ncbi:DUF4112 domain-containing protein [Algicella marina]|uniref:DUF4112 domain-containing protein n=1 Tax=Algicella marina TaxID=2683284 RepID=UPI0024E0043F|nr:DUF4112 domain-containing protein [Algicella marina]
MHQPTAPSDERARHIARLDKLSRLLDTQFRVPGTRLRFGLDSIIGLIPGVGDTLTLLPAGYLVLEARHMGVPRTTIARMMGNIAVDYFVGIIPLVGDIFDFGFKANRRNIALLQRHFEQAP